MRLLTNPIVLRFLVSFAAAVFAFVVGVAIIRRLRGGFVAEVSGVNETTTLETLPLHTYTAVIQQLKQQKHELQSLQQSERRRAKTTENISAAVLSNLSSGVLFFNPNGLLRQANNAAKQILGFSSPIGMSITELFRDATLSYRELGAETTIAQAVQQTLEDKTPSYREEANYVTPSGAKRTLAITITPVRTPEGEMLGAACLISDETEFRQIRHDQELRGALSAEKALELRNSLSAIAEYAQQLTRNCKEHTIHQIASDIASETDHLKRAIGGFLTEVQSTGARNRQVL